MTRYLANPAAWQASWDRQQESYLPDREQRFAVMLDAVDAVTGGAPPRLLDLAGGTGSIASRTLARFPGAEVTVLDHDPALLTIARASLGDHRIVDADLSNPRWLDALVEPGAVAGPDEQDRPAERGREGEHRGTARHDEGRSFDAVLTATALHWLPGDR